MRSVAIAAVLSAVLAGVAFADPKADKARADKLFDDGRKYLTSKEYALACTAFEQSQAADPAIGTQLNIALCYEQWGHVAAAYRAYVEADRLATAKRDDRATGARKKLDELGPKVPHLTLVLPAGADVATIVLLDGQVLSRDKVGIAGGHPGDDQAVEVGPHAIEVRVPGAPPHTTAIDLTPGQRATVALDVPKTAAVVIARPPPPPPSTRSPARLYGGIGLTAIGAIAIGTSAFVGLAARQDYADAVGRCPMLQCTTEADFDATSHARTRANQMTFVAGGGVALAAAGVFLILTSNRTSHTAVAPVVAPGVVGLAIGGTL